MQAEILEISKVGLWRKHNKNLMHCICQVKVKVDPGHYLWLWLLRLADFYQASAIETILSTQGTWLKNKGDNWKWTRTKLSLSRHHDCLLIKTARFGHKQTITITQTFWEMPTCDWVNFLCQIFRDQSSQTSNLAREVCICIHSP